MEKEKEKCCQQIKEALQTVEQTLKKSASESRALSLAMHHLSIVETFACAAIRSDTNN